MSVVGRLIELMSAQFRRHEFQIHEMVRIIMGILVSIGVS
jgi:hypothetical protein